LPTEEQISVLAVDDNEQVLQAVRLKLGLAGGFEWRGSLSSADALPEKVAELRPNVILLDIDMPGRDPFDALAASSEQSPDSRVLVFSGHVTKQLVDKAIEAGSWGYVSKSDGENSLIAAIKAVAAGSFVLSDEVRAVYGHA